MKQITKFLSSITPRQWLIIFIVAVVIIGIVIYLNNRNTDNANNKSPNPNPAPAPSDFPLRSGSRNDSVRLWQQYLNSKGATLVEDGIWGPLTESASKQYAGTNLVNESLFNSLITR